MESVKFNYICILSIYLHNDDSVISDIKIVVCDAKLRILHKPKKKQQEVSLKKIIVEGYRAVGSLNDSFQSSNLLL